MVSSLYNVNDKIMKKNVCCQEYYLSWVKFINVLKTIKKFAEEASQQSVFQKFKKANADKEAFDKNINEFEAICRDLHLTIAIYSKEKREHENRKVLDDISILEEVI